MACWPFLLLCVSKKKCIVVIKLYMLDPVPTYFSKLTEKYVKDKKEPNDK